ncbi:hypothetical protein C8R48DRAFT_782563 [Suillus tomentosus]|nr:hypothetical protein C8R48DRAFT_782563 [Suillus tomentosus]
MFNLGQKFVNKEYTKMTRKKVKKNSDGDDEDKPADGGDGEKKNKQPNLTRLLRARLQKVVDKADEETHRVFSNVFMEMPSKKDYPMYYTQIKRPMCIETVFKHLKRKEYQTSLDFANDVELVFPNALEFEPITNTPTRLRHLRHPQYHLPQSLASVLDASTDEEAQATLVDECDVFVTRHRSGKARFTFQEEVFLVSTNAREGELPIVNHAWLEDCFIAWTWVPLSGCSQAIASLFRIPIIFFYKLASTRIDALLTELKRLDDKMIFAEVHLLESRVYRGIGNLSKSKVSPSSAIPIFSLCALTSVKCKGSLDLQSGVLHAEDKDYATAYSYFYETFENMSSQDDPAALNALKYMLLCKVMLNMPEDVTSLLSINLAVKYAQLREIESMRAIALAHQNRNLSDFEKALPDYKQKLSSDPTIRSHLAALYDTLLQQNLLRIVEPYSVVEIGYVAKKVGQGRQDVEAKCTILDKVFHGVLDQGRGCLIIFDELEADNTYGAAIGTLEQVSKVIDSLYAKTVRIRSQG